MTERGQPSIDGSPACPFVAFDDDRDARSDRPDHRHRCFAEADPAPRALAHQEAYCLSSAFPVCPTFQAWARREAAQARSDRDAANAAAAGAAAAGAAAASAAAAADQGPDPDDRPGAAGGTGRATPEPQADEWVRAQPDDIPIESQPRRNPPRDWAAPPPWASGQGPVGSTGSTGPGSAGGGAGGSTSSRAPSPGSPPGGAQPPAPEFLAPLPPEGRGLAGSAADRLASGESIVDPARPVSPPPTRPSDLPSAGPDPDLAGLVGGAAIGGAAARGGAPMSDAERAAVGYPPPTRSGRRPAVSSTRADRERDRDRQRQPQREHVQSDGPSWERARRYEAYPTIKTRAGLGGLPALPRAATLAAALGVAALVLFFLPALLGIGGGDAGPSASPTGTTAAVTPLPSPTPEPAPTPQVYVIKQGDTLSKIAKEFGLTVDQLLDANKDTIEDPDLIAVGDEIIIPVPVPDEVSGGSEGPDSEESTAP
jgi:LysM repeat protein